MPPSTTMPWIALVPDISGVCSVLGTLEMAAKPTKPASTRIARLVSSIRPATAVSPSRTTHAPATTSSSKFRASVALLAEQQLEQRLHVARVELAGVLGHRRRQVQRRDDRHVVLDDDLAGLGQLAVAARLAGEVDDHRAGLHALDRLGGDQPRRRAAGHERGGDDDVEALDRVGQRLLLLGLLLVGELARVAALAGRLDPEVEPLGAERLDLLGDLGAHVVARRLRAQAPRRGQRLQARDADAEHEHLGRRDRARRGHQHRVEARRVLGAEQRRLVAGDVGLRGQRVHRLRARDARDRLHREGGHARPAPAPAASRAACAGRGSRRASPPRRSAADLLGASAARP